MKITIVAGARPNFMKVSSIIRSLSKAANSGIDFRFRLVHTGQHYDKSMSSEFFDQLQLPNPDANLGCSGGSQAEQTACVMVAFERELLENKTNLVLVVGDVNSTMACAIAAKKLCLPVAHVEGGIRSGDMTMPEEVNRIVTDSITDLFYTTSEIANKNLQEMGVSDRNMVFVGNTMIDTLLYFKDSLRPPELFNNLTLQGKKYLVVTLHRPSNVDDINRLDRICRNLGEGSSGLPMIFPVHPRTRRNLERIYALPANLILSEPMSYFEFNYLVSHAAGVITDSGGISEETTVLGIPCLTLRNSTERPETVTIGTNEVVGDDPEVLKEYVTKMISGDWKKGAIPPLWDGLAGERIVNDLVSRYHSGKFLV